MSSALLPSASSLDRIGNTSDLFDVAIVGGGIAGPIAALQLGRAGYRVALCDLHKEPPAEFRAEQLVGQQVGRLEELGLLGRLTRDSRLVGTATNGRLGKAIDRTQVDQYGVSYHSMVEALRDSLPDTVELIHSRVAAVANGPALQSLRLAGDRDIKARLVILATGLSTVLPKRLGLEYRMINAGHSLALGFDMDFSATSSQDSTFVYYGEHPRDRMDYLAIFPMQGTSRANLFCYHEQGSEWVRSFCSDPKARLLEVMPGLARMIAPFEIVSPVQVRSNDLRVATDPARDGVVLVGDAFQTPCPAAGTGIDRLLSDVDILCGTYVPSWFATPGMARDKIAAYYADPAKQAFDAECLRIAQYRRAVSTGRSVWWTVHRKQVFFRRQLRGLLQRRRSLASTAAG